ncbi:MAG: hypothetical protein GX615_14685, partial [Lentisphaerae bacterium]|nr:hypothetical protein [Lentisphaerota bacterium]
QQAFGTRYFEAYVEVKQALAEDPQYWRKLVPPAALAPKEIPAEQLMDVPFDLLSPEVVQYAFPKGVPKP